MMQISNDLVVFPEKDAIVARATTPLQQQEFSKLTGKPNDKNLYQLPLCRDAVCFLNNIGFEGALQVAPFMFDTHPLVEGKYQPMQHQLLTAAFMTVYPRAHILSEPRLGKTSSVILACDYLQRKHEIIGGVLIITTVTTIHGVWKEGILSAIPDARVQVVHGPARAHALAVPADFYITNYDSCRLSLKDFTAAIEEGRIGAIVVDEMTHVGNSGSQRHKAIYQMCSKLSHVWGLTGSPADNPEMVYGMARVINPTMLPCTTKTAWLNMTSFQYGPQPYMRKPVPGVGKIIRKAMYPAIRYMKKDILDLPPVTTQVRMCAMSKEQEAKRLDLKVDATTLLESGERITAVNGGVLLTKLMQVAMGCVKDDKGEAQILSHKERTEAMLEAIGETPQKTVVFCGYIAGIQMLVKEIRAAGYTCDYVDGSVTGKKRAEILAAFQNSPDPHVLVCHPTTTAMGVELSAADTMIFNGVPLTGGFVYAQSIERLSSAKQKAKSISIVHIISTPEERKALEALQKGYDLGQEIAGMFHDFTQRK